jgi:hypothetical protein
MTCGKCQTGFVLVDRDTGEPYCFNCGWRPQPSWRSLEQRAAAPAPLPSVCCKYCDDPVTPSSSQLCQRHLLLNRERVRRYMRTKHGFKPWQPGRPGRAPLSVSLRGG